MLRKFIDSNHVIYTVLFFQFFIYLCLCKAVKNSFASQMKFFIISNIFCVFSVTCPSNQVFSTCAGCFTTCEERFRPGVCTRECRRQCTCPENLPYLNGNTCVAENECPVGPSKFKKHI